MKYHVLFVILKKEAKFEISSVANYRWHSRYSVTKKRLYLMGKNVIDNNLKECDLSTYD